MRSLRTAISLAVLMLATTVVGPVATASAAGAGACTWEREFTRSGSRLTATSVQYCGDKPAVGGNVAIEREICDLIDDFVYCGWATWKKGIGSVSTSCTEWPSRWRHSITRQIIFC